MDPPWLVDVPAWYDALFNGYVVVHQDDARLYWTGFPDPRWSRRARDALVSSIAPWRVGRDPVPADGRCVLVLLEDEETMMPIYKWPVHSSR